MLAAMSSTYLGTSWDAYSLAEASVIDPDP
jgi:hypothetical protein